MSRAPPQAWSLARQCQEHGASRVIALAMSQRDHVASRRGDRADYRRSPSLACARLSRRLGSCDLTVAPVDVSRAATGVVACASVPRARRLTRHRAGHEPTRPCRVSPRGPSRPSSVAVARVRASVASTRVVCVLTVAPVVVSRAATDVVACASVPRARRLARHRAGHEPTRSMSRLAAGTEPTIVDRRHSRARVCRVDSGPVFSRSRRSLSRAPPRAWSLARQCQVHGASRVIALAMSQRDNVASRRGNRADPRRSPSLACARLSRRLGSVISRSRRSMSRAQPRTWSLARQCQEHGASRVIALAMSQRGNVASRRGNRADHRRSLSRTCARLSRRHGSCDLTLSPVDVSRAATGVVACASVPCARRLARHRAGHCPTRPCRVSPRGLSRPSSVAVARVRASVAPTRVWVLCSHGRVSGCLARSHGRGRLRISAKCTAPCASSRWP